MDTSGWQDRGEFPLLELTARFAFKTRSSVSFDLGMYVDVLELSDGPIDLGPGAVFKVIGHVDVHHPCDDHIKAHVRFVLPAEYQMHEKTKQLVEQLFCALGIAGDETFEANFLTAGTTPSLVRDVDRDGFSPWI